MTTNLTELGEYEEFTEALMDQLSVERSEEKEIEDLSLIIKDDSNFKIKFDRVEKVVDQVLDDLKEKINDFVGIPVSQRINLEFADLAEFKKLKGKKVFCPDNAEFFVTQLFEAISIANYETIKELIRKDTPKFLVYSTYAKSYLSKISTTYGDYLDSSIYLNMFILSSYPQIILYKQGPPFDSRFETVKSGYIGALKMTLLEELVHSIQENLHNLNKAAVKQVNSLNEELAKIILEQDDSTVGKLSEYLKLPPVPDDFPIARRANLFFTLNPDNFIVNVLGPDVMTFTKVEIDPKISEMIPELLNIYQRWLKPIQTHHAAFTTMEGMAEFTVQNILKHDKDFQNYLTTFLGTELSSYQIRKSMGKDFTDSIYNKFGKKTFKMLIENPPNTRELKEPKIYLRRSK